MEKDVEIKKWKEGNPPVEFTFKKQNKSIFELDRKSRKIFGPTLIDCFDDARTPTEREIFDEQIKQKSEIVDRVTEAKQKVKRLKKEKKKLLPDAKKFRRLKRNQSEGGEVRSQIYKDLYRLCRNEAERIRNNGQLKTKKAIAIHIAKNLPSEIENLYKDHALKHRLTADRISRII